MRLFTVLISLGLSCTLAFAGGSREFTKADDDYIAISHQEDYSDGFTAMAFLKTGEEDFQRWWNDGTGVDFCYGAVVGAGTVRFQCFDGGSVAINFNSSTAVDDDNWHHVALVWDGSTNSNAAIIYIDGESDATGTSSSGSMGTAECGIFLGSGANTGCTNRSDSNGWNGEMAEFRYYDTNLPAWYIKELSRRGNIQHTYSSNRQVYLPLNDAGSTMKDLSGNGNDGTNNGTSESFEGSM